MLIIQEYLYEINKKMEHAVEMYDKSVGYLADFDLNQFSLISI